MCDELTNELREGNKLATALVDHLTRMGGASSAAIPVLDRHEEYMVQVMPRARYEEEQQRALSPTYGSSLQQLLDLHGVLLDENAYCYFELAYTRQTMWMAWLCSKPKESDPNRKIIAQGQGGTPEEAAAAALKSYTPN